jgi:hypothetical protein
LIGNRIRYAIGLLGSGDEQLAVKLGTSVDIDREAIVDFLKIVQFSIFTASEHIARFIEAICFGNMRLALQMFTTFLTSGATDVQKMLSIYKRQGTYHVAFHEFVKSIMLGERLYYKEEQSPIVNVFECSSERSSSHFTAWRLLRLLLSHRAESTAEGKGYVPLARVVTAFEDVFDNRADILQIVERLVRRQLIESNTRATTSLKGVSHIRVTSAGWYYLRYLVNSFAYLDLVLQDTPINNLAVARRLTESVSAVDNLGDREDNKLERLRVRFERVKEFLAYLEAEEAAEHKQFRLSDVEHVFGERIVPALWQRFDGETDWIERRIRENREKYAEEMAVEPLEEEARVLGLESRLSTDSEGEEVNGQTGSQ